MPLSSKATLAMMRALIEDYAKHDSWRCKYFCNEWADNNSDCHCGLVTSLKAVGLPTNWALDDWRFGPS